MRSWTVVDAVVPVAGADELNLRDTVWSYALDQRAFGPRMFWLVLADEDGRLRGIAYTRRRAPFAWALTACLDQLGAGAAAAVVLVDEPVDDDGPPSPDFLDRFERAGTITAARGVQLVDWISCDDDRFRAARLRTMDLCEQPDWWDVRPIPRAGSA